MQETVIKRGNDLRLSVQKETTGRGLQVTFHLESDKPYVLHWGLTRQRPGRWESPPPSLWPKGTNRINDSAVQTPFHPDQGAGKTVLRFEANPQAPFLVFDLFCPVTKRWENNHGKDYYLVLNETSATTPPPDSQPKGPPPGEVLRQATQSVELLHQKILALDAGGELAVAVTHSGGRYQLLLLTNVPGPLALHWGVPERARGQWRLPPAEFRTADTVVVNEQAVETPFGDARELRFLKLEFPENNVPAGVSFVLHQTASNQWIKQRGQNIFIPVAPRPEAAGDLTRIEERIVEGEVGEHGWTLMHRFNLAHELADEAGDSREAWTAIAVWLRYSAIRQLDWQRNYNTKPRELTHSQDRLTAKLAQSWIEKRDLRDLIRLSLTCVGRGGEGQRIRDEILQIMHRHHIKEVGGTWMEQWHQKLHNNTTPDDIAICEAYLEFLRGNGDLNRYIETLGAHGVTRERLAGFDRPITTNPEFHGHLRDALIHDFENYLKLLKSVHSATDLETASNTVGHLLDGPARDALNFVRHQFSNPGASIIDLARSITFVRQNLASKLEHDGDTGHVREMLYLDLALEDALRMVIERSVHTGIAGEQLVGLVTAVLENVRVTSANDELGQCQREWQRLPESARFSADWALHAKATLDRLRRAVADATDFAYKELQPIADKLGMAFNADEWARKLFSEEVIRGRPAFVLSLLIRHLDPLLRRAAKLGNWQVISPSQAIGFVEVVQTLREVQSKRYGLPTVIVAEKVSGDEEPPEGVRAVITPSSVDLVSHVAVRARNAQLLFATCYDTAVFEKLKTLQSRAVRLRVTPAGDVTIDDSPGVIEENKKPRLPAPIINVRPNVSARPLRCVEFEPGLVGGKSNNLRALTETLPDWIHAPRSVALPFGAFDQMLKEAINRDVASRHRELLTKVETDPETVLPQLRDCIQQVRLPDALIAMLEKTMKAEGLSLPEDWELAARRVAQVWASKWNDRAFFSRQANRVSHHTVQMAVLIQEVVPAQYAFVIHTVNPFNNDPDEIYAEVVAGLGETLVGNHPGRALSFVADKTDRTPTVLGYPSKSIGLFGGGLIFRSDSNAEDLEGYAGAGLYDSVLLHSPREVTLDYSNDPLVWNEPFRTDVLSYIANVGLAVERAFRSPQDIEGACVEGKFFVVQTRPQVGLA